MGVVSTFPAHTFFTFVIRALPGDVFALVFRCPKVVGQLSELHIGRMRDSVKQMIRETYAIQRQNMHTWMWNASDRQHSGSSVTNYLLCVYDD